MRKIFAIFALLFFYLMVGPVGADPCMLLSDPPGAVPSGEIEDIKKDLNGKIVLIAKKNCGETGSFGSSLEMVGPGTFLYSYSLVYGPSSRYDFSESLIYDKKEGNWIFRQRLSEVQGNGVDLNGDGIPELISVYDNSFRTYVERGKSVLALDRIDGKYKRITGLGTLYTANEGVCQDDTYNKEDLDVDKSGKKYPLIALSRENIERKGCDEKKVLTETWQYQWDPAHKRYMNKGYSNSSGETVSFDLEKASGKIALLYEKSGNKKKLGSTFSKDSSLFAFFRSGEHLFFKAEDKDWQSEYAWDVEKNELFYRAMNKKTGKKYYSKGRTKAVFEKIPWIISKF